jgi:hypothetical protein
MLATKFNVTINHAIGAPGHGKDVVDAFNAVSKEFLRTIMCQIVVPDKDQSIISQDKKIVPYSVNKQEEGISLVEEAARLCDLE